MKKIIVVIFLFMSLFVTLSARQEGKKQWVGYLVDKMCAKGMVMDDIKKSDTKAAKHTRECALEEACSAEGYGLVKGGKFYKFNEAGDVQAKKFLQATKREDNIKVKIIGAWDGNILSIDSIKEIQSHRMKRIKKK